MTRPLPSIPAIAVLFLVACGGGSPVPSDSTTLDSLVPNDSNQGDIDELGDAETDGDLTDQGISADTSPDGANTNDISIDEGAPTWITPSSCENTGDLGVQPLTLLHEVDVKEHPLGHYQSQMVDIERDPEQDRIYAVGWGGFYVFNEFDWGIQLAGRHNGQGAGLGQFYRLEVLEESVVAVTNRDYGLAFIPASDPANLYMSWVFAIGSGSGMAQVDDYLHVVTHTGDLHSFDVSTPTVPNKLGKISGLGNAWDIVVKGNKGYVADNSLGVVLVDFSDPAWPVIGDTFEAVSGVQDLTIQYNVLYVAVGSHGVQMFDISDPSNPTPSGLISYPKPVNSVSTSGKFLWGTTYDDVFVIDILGGFEPYPLAHRRTDEWAMHVDAVGTKAYVANWGKLQVYNIDASLYGPDLLVDRDILLYWNKPEELELSLTNMGTADLEIYGAAIDDPRFTLVLEQAIIPRGETRTLKIQFADDGEPVETALCLSTNDADQSMLTLPVRSTLQDVSLALGSPAPDFTVNDTEGQVHTLSDQIGKPVLLSFFSPDDPRAPSHFSDLQASIRAKFPDEEVVVWSIGPGGALSILSKFKDDMGLTFPILHDESGQIALLFAQPDVFPGASYPKDWLISKTGHVIYTNNTYNPAEIKRLIKEDIQP
jgi:peroxiredoxin